MTTPTTIDVHLESLKLAIDNSPDIASILDREGKLVFVNQRISVLGYEQDELIGVSVRDLIHPADWPVVEAGLNMLGASEAPEESVEYRWKTKSGDWRYLESRGRTYALKDFFGYLISSRDVTEQHILVDELRSASELFKTTFDLSRNLVSVTRAGTGEILNVNEQWLRAAGFTREEVIGKTTVEIGVWGGKDRRNDMMENLTRDGYVRNFQTYSFTKTGERLDLIVDAKLIELDGEQCLLLSASNITEQREIEAQLRQAHKMEAMGQLTGGVAHDFNNILGIIYGNTELGARDDAIDPSYVDAILKACDRGAALTQQLLAFSRKQALMPSIINLKEMSEELGPLFQRTLGSNISIVIDAEPNLWRCSADMSQMETALVNLALNARDAMPSGGELAIELRNRVVQMDEEDDITPGEYVQLKFIDSGTGMPPEVLEKVFEPFFTTKEVGKGTGLGLSMIFGFVNQSGGAVQIDSTVGGGTAVTLLFPRVQDERLIDEDDNAPISRGDGEHVLLLEDNRELKKVIEMMLSRLNYRVSSAGDEHELERLLRHNHHYDLMISDIMLPGESRGPEVAARVRERLPDIKLLFISGYAKSALDAYESDYQLIMKPFSSTELSKAIATALGKTETQEDTD